MTLSTQEPEYNFTIFVTDGETRTQVESTIIVTEPKKRILTPFFETQYLFTVYEVCCSVVCCLWLCENETPFICSERK